MRREVVIFMLLPFLMWASLTTTPFSNNVAHNKSDRPPQHPPAATIAALNEMKKREEYRAESRIGSRPPNCGHKCGGCFPCQPVQSPATTDKVDLLIANYEPEGWKCKCGLSIFDP